MEKRKIFTQHEAAKYSGTSKMDSPYYGNLHNADKSPRSRIFPIL